LIVSDAIIAALGNEADAAVPLGIVAVGVGVDPPMSGFGTNRTSSDVRSSVAIGGKADVARIAQFGRE
jgi:hypothetical protein